MVELLSNNDFGEFDDLLYTLMFGFAYFLIGLVNLSRMPLGERKHKLAFVVCMAFGLLLVTYDAVVLYESNFVNAFLHDMIFVALLFVLKAYFKPIPEERFIFNLPILGVCLMQFAYAFIHITAYSDYRIPGEWKWYTYFVSYHLLDFLMMSTLLFCRDYLGIGRWLQNIKRKITQP